MTTTFNTADLASCDADTLAVSTSSSCAEGTAPEPNSQARQLKGAADGRVQMAGCVQQTADCMPPLLLPAAAWPCLCPRRSPIFLPHNSPP